MDIFESKKTKPMLATSDKPFDSVEHLYEIKWDGIRCLAYLDGDTILRSRNNFDITNGYPEFKGMHKSARVKPLILDGEIVVMKNGKPSFNEWQKRGRLKDYKQLERIAEANPAVYIAFDILYAEGKSVMSLPLIERKEILAEAIEEQTSLVLSRHILEKGIDFYKAAAAQELEGVVAKKLDSPYLPGKRTNYWLKFKRIEQEDFVICGFLPGTKDGIGSLVLGTYNGEQLIYRGLVGTGISGKNLHSLVEYISSNTNDKYPFAKKIKELAKGVWINLGLVCTVEYLERRENGLRHPTFRGLRFDKEPTECRIEGLNDEENSKN